MANVQLSLIKPDFEDIRSQLEATLSGYTAWRDMLPTGTGRTLADWIAAVGANDQYAIEHAFRESFRTARLDSSIFAQALMLGVRLVRKAPASTRVRLTNTSTNTLYVDGYSQFSSSKYSLFNRDAFSVGPMESKEVTLFQGVVKSKESVGDGSDFQMFVSEDADFTVSDQDVRVFVNNVLVERSERGLWNFPDKPGWQDATTALGQLLICFGGQRFGTTPETGSSVRITYVVTDGADTSDAGFGDTVVSSVYPELSGNSVSGLSGGGSSKDAVFYRKVSPYLFSGRYGATTEDEFQAVANSYPGVIDVRVVGQHTVAPMDLRWMNMVQVSPLIEGGPWNAQQWDEFDRWYRERIMYPIRLFRKDPLPFGQSVSVSVFCQAHAELATVKATVEAQIRKLFRPRSGFIDSGIFLSDIHAAIRSADSSIEYAEVHDPVDDVVSRVSTVKAELSATNAAGGVLPPKQYSYSVTAVLEDGSESLGYFTSVDVPVGSNTVVLKWRDIPGVDRWRIYGRQRHSGIGLLAELTKQANPSLLVNGQWTVLDSGVTPPNMSIQATGGVPHRYPVLTSLSVEVQYTGRQFYNLGNLK